MNLPLNTDLTGKVAVVTGAAGTLCSVFSKALAASGAKVALLGRTYANVQKLADEITAEGGTAKAYECNVLDKTAVMACHEHVLADFGSCDILINGAGGNHPSATTDKEYYEPGDLDAHTKSFFDLDETGVASVFNLNFMGILIPTQAFARDITVRSCRSTSGPVISAGLNRTIPSLSTEQSGCPFHLTRIRPSSSSLASSSLRRRFCSTSCRNLSFCDVFSSHIQYTSILSTLFERKKGAGHWSVKTNNPASIIL